MSYVPPPPQQPPHGPYPPQYPVPPKSTGPSVVVIVLLVLAGVFVLVCGVFGWAVMKAGQNAVATTQRTISDSSTADSKKPTPSTEKDDSGDLSAPDDGWQYSEEDDDMGRGKIKDAAIISENTVKFDFPYDGEQHGAILIRHHPKFGDQLIFGIEKGQFQSGISGCDVSISFNGSTPKTYHADPPSDDSTTKIFLTPSVNFSRFVAECKKAKTLRIEAPFFQEGERTFKFNVAGLKWD